MLGSKGCLKYCLLDWEAALHEDEPTASVKVTSTTDAGHVNGTLT